MLHLLSLGLLGLSLGTFISANTITWNNVRLCEHLTIFAFIVLTVSIVGINVS